jgi:hypothetical protein
LASAKTDHGSKPTIDGSKEKIADASAKPAAKKPAPSLA